MVLLVLLHPLNLINGEYYNGFLKVHHILNILITP